MSTRNWLAVGLVSSLALSAPAIAKEEYAELESEALLLDLLNYAKAPEQIIPALPDSITQVDPTLLRVFLYNERKRPETDKLAMLVENRLQELLIPFRRFKLVEARETKTTRVISSATSLQVSNSIESIERLRTLGKELGVDGVLMYAPFVTNRVVVVQLKLVRVSDGEITWSHRYTFDYDVVRQAQIAELKAEQAARETKEKERLEFERRNRDTGLYVYGGLTGLVADRPSTSSGTPGERADQSFNLGFMALRNTSFWENVAVGLDAEYLQGGGANGKLRYGILSATPLLFLRLDPVFTKGDNMGVLNLYAGVGHSFSFTESLSQPISGKLGFLVRFTPDLFMNLGLTQLPAQTVRPAASTNLQDTMQFGGLTYHASVGMAFK